MIDACLRSWPTVPCMQCGKGWITKFWRLFCVPVAITNLFLVSPSLSLFLLLSLFCIWQIHLFLSLSLFGHIICSSHSHCFSLSLTNSFSFFLSFSYFFSLLLSLSIYLSIHLSFFSFIYLLSVFDHVITIISQSFLSLPPCLVRTAFDKFYELTPLQHAKNGHKQGQNSLQRKELLRSNCQNHGLFMHIHTYVWILSIMKYMYV